MRIEISFKKKTEYIHMHKSYEKYSKLFQEFSSENQNNLKLWQIILKIDIKR